MNRGDNYKPIAQYTGTVIVPSPIEGDFSDPAYGTEDIPELPRTRYNYLTDHNKNITTLTDTAGTPLITYQYDAYGNLLNTLTTHQQVLNPFRFSSEYYDHELDLIYYNYRHYNPKDGRWLSKDPIEEQGGINLYSFCTNNSINYHDLNGLWRGPDRFPELSWAPVCAELGDTWQTLADKLKLDVEEVDKWVKNSDRNMLGPDYFPQPGKLYLIPNTLAFYSTPLGFEDDLITVSLQYLNNEKLLNEIRVKKGLGFKIIDKLLYEKKYGDAVFSNLWQEEGIYGIYFNGHGGPEEPGSNICGYYASKSDGSFLKANHVSPPYKLAIIEAYHCFGFESNWFKHLSLKGSYKTYAGKAGRLRKISVSIIEGKVSVVVSGTFRATEEY